MNFDFAAFQEITSSLQQLSNEISNLEIKKENLFNHLNMKTFSLFMERNIASNEPALKEKPVEQHEKIDFDVVRDTMNVLNKFHFEKTGEIYTKDQHLGQPLQPIEILRPNIFGTEAYKTNAFQYRYIATSPIESKNTLIDQQLDLPSIQQLPHEESVIEITNPFQEKQEDKEELKNPFKFDIDDLDFSFASISSIEQTTPVPPPPPPPASFITEEEPIFATTPLQKPPESRSVRGNTFSSIQTLSSTNSERKRPKGGVMVFNDLVDDQLRQRSISQTSNVSNKEEKKDLDKEKQLEALKKVYLNNNQQIIKDIATIIATENTAPKRTFEKAKEEKIERKPLVHLTKSRPKATRKSSPKKTIIKTSSSSSISNEKIVTKEPTKAIMPKSFVEPEKIEKSISNEIKTETKPSTEERRKLLKSLFDSDDSDLEED